MLQVKQNQAPTPLIPNPRTSKSTLPVAPDDLFLQFVLGGLKGILDLVTTVTFVFDTQYTMNGRTTKQEKKGKMGPL